MKKKILSFLLVAVLTIFGFALGGCGEKYNKYDVSAYVFGAKYGDVVGGNDTYLEGTKVTIKAVPKTTISQTPNRFICWVHDDKVVSTEAEYSFVVDLNTAGIYIALFESPDLEYVFLNDISFSYGTFDYGIESDTALSDFSLKLGYNERELTQVYSLDEDAIGRLSQQILKEEIYEGDELPFTFNKTKDIYIQVDLKYTRGELVYTSSTVIKMDAVRVGEDVKQVNGATLNEPVLNGGTSTMTFTENPTITLNFDVLSNFFELTENEEE